MAANVLAVAEIGSAWCSSLVSTRDRLSSPLLSLSSSSTELPLLEVTVCGLETLRGREEVDFGVEARSETRALLGRERSHIATPPAESAPFLITDTKILHALLSALCSLFSRIRAKTGV